MTPIKFGWAYPSIEIIPSAYEPHANHKHAQILPSIIENFDSLWTDDHLYGFDHGEELGLENYASVEDPETGQLITNHQTVPYLEGWTSLTWLAARFPNVQIGPLVLSVGYRSPAMLAKMSANLQTLSGGQLVLGIGAGWRVEEYDAYGFEYYKASKRIQQLEEALQIIRLMWTETAPTFKGSYYQIKEAYCEPRPDPPPPILIGGVGEKLMLPLIARYADWWNVDNTSVDDYRRKRDILFENAVSIERDPAEIVQTYLFEDDTDLPESAQHSQRWIDRLSPLIELGVTHFMIDFGNVASVELIERFAEEVIAPLNP